MCEISLYDILYNRVKNVNREKVEIEEIFARLVEKKLKWELKK